MKKLTLGISMSLCLYGLGAIAADEAVLPKENSLTEYVGPYAAKYYQPYNPTQADNKTAGNPGEAVMPKENSLTEYVGPYAPKFYKTRSPAQTDEQPDDENAHKSGSDGK